MLMTMVFTGGLLAKAYDDGMPDWLLVITGILSLLCTSQLVVAVVNWLATLAYNSAAAASNGFFQRYSP